MYNKIKEYKALLDEGVITQEEFKNKKRALLGMPSKEDEQRIAEENHIKEIEKQKAIEEAKKRDEEYQRRVKEAEIAEREHQRKLEEAKLAELERQRKKEEERKLEIENKKKQKEAKKAERQEKKGKYIAVAIIAVVILAIVGLIATNTICIKHEYNEATVVEPKTCWKCGKTDGDVKPLKKIDFPTSGVGSLLPIPKSNMGEIKWDDSDSFSVYIGNTTRDDFNDYIETCIESGFSIDYQRDEDSYYAYDALMNSLDIWYLDNNIMEIQISLADNISGGVENEIETIIKVLSESKSDVEDTFDIKDEDGDNLRIAGTFAGLTGEYLIVGYSDDSIGRVIFERDEEKIDIDKIVASVSEYLGEYDEYDSEWDTYTWATDDIQVELYVDERIYFDAN